MKSLLASTLGREPNVHFAFPDESSAGSVIGRFGHHSAKRELRITRLEAALHCSLDPVLCFGFAHALAEQVGVATEVLGGRKRDRIETVLDRKAAGGRKPGDPMRASTRDVARRGAPRPDRAPAAHARGRTRPAQNPRRQLSAQRGEAGVRGSRARTDASPLDEAEQVFVHVVVEHRAHVVCDTAVSSRGQIEHLVCTDHTLVQLLLAQVYDFLSPGARSTGAGTRDRDTAAAPCHAAVAPAAVGV